MILIDNTPSSQRYKWQKKEAKPKPAPAKVAPKIEKRAETSKKRC